MARTGRPPTSIEKRREEGTLRAHHSQTPLVIGGRDLPSCPAHLKGKARTAFNMLARDLKAGNILDKADRGMLAAAAMHYGVAMDAQERIERVGVLITVTRGARNGFAGYKVMEENPCVRTLARALTEFRQCCDSLGVGPAARARLANMGVTKGRDPAGMLPGIGEKPSLRVVNGEDE